MKISCTQENLNQGLFVVSHLATKSTTLPILNNILFRVESKSIKLSATNLEMGVRCVVRGKVEEDGDFTVQSKLLADYINLLPKEQVDLFAPKNSETAQDQVLEISCKNYSTKIKGQPAVDFPLIPQIKKENPYILDYEDLREAISQVNFAVSVNETRPEINGVLFNFADGKLTLAATDSYRLAEKTLSLEKKSNQEENRIIVPTKTLQEVLRILGGFKDPAAISDIDNVEVYISENQILFVLGNIELISRLVEGQYPDYRQIIPKDSKTKITLDAAEVTKAIKTTSLFARSGIYDINLEFLSDKKQLIISSANNQLGESTSQMDVDISGDNNSVVVNFRYLLDGLQNVNDKKVEIEMIDGNNPCVIKPVNKGNGYLYIIMPIKQ